MAIVKMRKLNMVALSYDKDAIFNALHKTGAVEIVSHAETAYTQAVEVDVEDLKTRIASLEASLFSLSAEVENYERETGEKSGILKDGFEVSYSDFMNVQTREKEINAVVERINALTDRKNFLKAEIGKLARQKADAEIYAKLQTPFSAFGDTAHTKGELGVVPMQSRDALEKALEETELCAFELMQTNTESALYFISAHKSVANEVESILSAYGFTVCPYIDGTGDKLYAGLVRKEKELYKELEENGRDLYAMKEQVKPLKIYCDYLQFVLEKEESAEKLRSTKTTFLLQAYVPETAEEEVKVALDSFDGANFYEFSDPTDDETPPTLLKNNKIVESFEGITNTYSAPHYREFDPNAVMAFFYSLFMGFIIGDAGYGILMLLGGGYLWWKNLARPTGMSRLAGAFAVGGIFAIIWGALFNSLFGFAIFNKTLMPNPQSDQWSIAGISVPSVLIISMELGVVQIFAGYICKAVQLFRRKDIIGGICEGIFWALFSVGVGLAIIGFLDEANLPKLASIGGITAGVSLGLAIVTAGRKEKLFGKFTKGFGTAYGVINYASDILSYARLYGLMLSGAVIAQIIATYSAQFIASGNIALILLAVVLLIVGNGFNLVMNLLGAYIHDARLQYVEFYGRFFEGEGELFTPLGSNQKYIYLLKDGQPLKEK